MRVFISYGAAGDQVTALRVQALGVANGLTVYVPPAHTRNGTPKLLDPEAARKLSEADVVLGVVSTGLTESCREELNTGIRLGKSMVVMSYPEYAAQLQPHFGANIVVIDPASPDKSERQIVQYLSGIKAQQDAKNALLFVGTLALALLIYTQAEQS